ncbi:hypothetical protein [Gordonia hankookensis]|uniref:Uncharacterized protein n=1 Tax=Gordonia hankookensis TaxID=589403 RepID=A0ABR7W5M5_9ACTN|nr:hypothetical protein [Gordonia hankookensis]MBD1318048.1 hypothetical protein [Gordonia hankookensis]
MSRSAARRAARRYSMRRVHVYRCPNGSGFHLGHSPPSVSRGEIGGSEYVAWRETFAPHRRRRHHPLVEETFAVVVDDDVTLDGLGLALAVHIAFWQRVHAENPTWREAIGPLRGDAFDIGELLRVPTAWTGERSAWENEAIAKLMEELRERGWISFDRRERSLRPGPRARGDRDQRAGMSSPRSSTVTEWVSAPTAR